MITQAGGSSGSTPHPSQPDDHLPPAPRAGVSQPFDRVAADYDRAGELNGKDLIGPWLAGLLPAADRRAIDLGCGPGGVRCCSPEISTGQRAL